MIERCLIDTGLYHAEDSHYSRCREALTKLSSPLLTCWPVLTEATWLLGKQPEGFRAIIDDFAAGLFALLRLNAALAHLADRESIRTLFTTDRRIFSIIRLKRNRALRIIPDIQRTRSI